MTVDEGAEEDAEDDVEDGPVDAPALASASESASASGGGEHVPVPGEPRRALSPSLAGPLDA